MIKYQKLINPNYEYSANRDSNFGFDIYDWKSNPYSCFKARIYIKLSTLFAIFLQFIKLTANHISLFYCISGVIAGLFFGVFNVYYFKGKFKKNIK